MIRSGSLTWTEKLYEKAKKAKAALYASVPCTTTNLHQLPPSRLLHRTESAPAMDGPDSASPLCKGQRSWVISVVVTGEAWEI